MPAQKPLRQSAANIVDGVKQYASYYNNEFNHMVTVVSSHADDIDNRYTKAEVDSKTNNMTTTAVVAAGTAFPGGTFTSGQLFWRTDELKMYAYDSASASWKVVIPSGSGSGLNADTVDGKHAVDLETKYNSGIRVSADSIPASTTQTFTIPLGDQFKAGRAIFKTGEPRNGGIVNFNTNPDNGASFGTGTATTFDPYFEIKSSSTEYVSHASVYLVSSSSSSLKLKSMYIDNAANNLVMIVENTYSGGSYTFNAKIFWEVWG